MTDNHLTIQAYSSGTTPIIDTSQELEYAEALGYSTFWPGGLYSDASLYVPRDVLAWWALKGAQRVVFRNSLDIVWEGYFDHLDSQVEADKEGIILNATGAWGAKLMRRRLRRYYCDTRVDDTAWVEDQPDGYEKIADVRRENDSGPCIMFVPRKTPWLNVQQHYVTYTCPVGETVTLMTFNAILDSKNNEDWDLIVYDATNASIVWQKSRTTTGTDTYNAQSITFSPVTAKIGLYFRATTNQTPAQDASGISSYGIFTSLKLYATTGNSGNTANNMDEIGKDLVAKFTDVFNGDATQIATPASPFAIEPFGETECTALADILTKAAGYGDGATPPNPWAFCLLDSEKAATPNGLPVLKLAMYPALTSYDYGARLADENVVAPVAIRRDYENIWNYITVKYTDANGKTQLLTPDNDAGLKDTTSIAAYGQREPPSLDYGFANATTAAVLAKRYLARWKDPQVTLESPLQVVGYINDSNSQPIPACRIQAGKRLRILDYLDDLSGTGLTVWVTGTQYSAESEICSLTAGPLSPTFGVERRQLNPYRPLKAPVKPVEKKPKKKKR